jgi:alkyldihydroxyacetonephosphate synthase
VARLRKHWGWGYDDEQSSADELRGAAAFLRGHLGYGSEEVEMPAALPALRPPRLQPPPRLAAICDPGDHDRALHAYGASYRDVVRGFRGEFADPPDVVAHPRDEREVEAVLEWALGAGAAVVPFGGGTSVVGGVEPGVGDGYAGVVTIDVKALDRVLEIDEVSLSARIQAGATGPGLEAQLAERGVTLRHFPQSFQFQTLGGAIATRAGGHYATGRTHIDDFVQSIRALTPAGPWESRRLPGSGAGVSPDRILIGSEGTLGVITEAWVRVVRRPARRASAGVRFAAFAAAAEAARAIVQSGLQPANCRVIDPVEARITGSGDGSHALLVLGFESAELDVESAMSAALACCTDHGGEWERRGTAGAGEQTADAVGTWREAFLRAPYLRDTFVAMRVLSETFETAITWERFPAFHAAVTAAALEALREVCGAGTVTCRLTHVYPDGPAPYFTVLGPARRGDELEQWAAIKQAASDAIIAAGGTITHHHAIGRDHRPWYDRQRPDPFAAALAGAKSAVDPGWALNPGVLLDPPSPARA